MLSYIRSLFRSAQPVHLITLSFLAIILTGSLLLTLPFCSRSGEFTNFVDALFVATSCTCVTGLSPFDTWTHWNELGQVIMILLIQVGGLGLVTLTSGITLLIRRKLGLKELRLAAENTAGENRTIRHLIKVILLFTFACEAVGALLLMQRFVPEYGGYGVWISVFTSISAYCNAGFDILGFVTPGQSLIPYVSDPLVCLTVGGLIVVGGIGFVVVSDIVYSKIYPRVKKERSRRLTLHSKLVLLCTAVLIVLGTVVFFFLEYDHTLKGMNFGSKLNASLFQSVSARTAGFASVDIASELDVTKIFTVILMFIGASPGSTGGGIKTTTFIVLVCTVLSVLRGHPNTIVFRHRVSQAIVYRALAICSIAALVVVFTTTVITICSPHVSGINALLESTSAFATVGLSASVTPTLDPISKLMVSLTMYIGRVGPVSLGLTMLLHHPMNPHSEHVLPEGKIIVG